MGWNKSAKSDAKKVRMYKQVAKVAKWKSDKNYGYGISYLSGYGSEVAMVAMVPKKPGPKLVEKIYAVVDCGEVINTSGAINQVEGAIIDAYGAAKHQSVTFDKGRAQQSNFHDYPILRIHESPEVIVSFFPSPRKIGGVGEIGYAATVPAITNAIADARGLRITHLPMSDQVS
jgi:isoquinoline 1-oxidoreductase beta subunit